MRPQNMPPWHKDYLELIISRNFRHRRNSENPSKSYPFVKDIYIIRETSICKGVLFVQKEKDD